LIRKAALDRGYMSEPAALYAELHCTAFSQFQKQTPYPDIVRQLGTIVQLPDLGGGVVVIVDCTSEHAVYDMMRADENFYNATIIPISITPGIHVTVDEYGWYKVPSLEIDSSLVVAAESQTLVIERGGGQEQGDAERLNEQLKALRHKISRVRRSDKLTSDGTDAEHDDMAKAVAYTTWWAKYTGALEMAQPAGKAEEFNPAKHGLTE
jgi:hypothetical protein